MDNSRSKSKFTSVFLLMAFMVLCTASEAAAATNLFKASRAFDVGESPWYIAVADLNGDKKGDIAVANSWGNSVSILLGKGDGTFNKAVDIAVGKWLSSIAAGDFNGDGKIDLAVTVRDENKVAILIGNGDGTFRTPIKYTSGDDPNSVAVGDFNGDGKADIAVGGDGLIILLGYRNGMFKAPIKHAFGSFGSVAVGDFNADRKVDIVATGSAFGIFKGSAVMLGIGNGTFKAPKYFSTSHGSCGVVVGDFNNDGMADFALSNYWYYNTYYGVNDTVSIFIGNGDGTFNDEATYPAGH